MDSNELLEALRATSGPIGQLKVPSDSGVYAWFLQNGVILPGFTVPSDRLIYVGSSSSLAQRQYETHFNSRQTGFSTIRRTLGALLKEELQLTTRPRGRGKTPQDFYCYRFEPDGEERLTTWMQETIQVGICPTGSYEAVEDELISTALPLLNLKGSANPDAREIKRLRKVCADEARSRR